MNSRKSQYLPDKLNRLLPATDHPTLPGRVPSTIQKSNFTFRKFYQRVSFKMIDDVLYFIRSQLLQFAFAKLQVFLLCFLYFFLFYVAFKSIFSPTFLNFVQFNKCFWRIQNKNQRTRHLLRTV